MPADGGNGKVIAAIDSDMLNPEQPQRFTCPYCKKMVFSDATSLEHVSAEHTILETSLEVVCPACAELPDGEPNLVTDDFAGHLSLVHRTGPREVILFLDKLSAIRRGGGMRRIPGRTMGRVPHARRSNMHFRSSSGLSRLSPPGRESVDPIAELLSQLSGITNNSFRENTNVRSDGSSGSCVGVGVGVDGGGGGGGGGGGVGYSCGSNSSGVT
uniref:Di19 zinc-binding domain-containing protein n=1 Tax=Glossina austeni TaxID=7395 RepID=A0A1A9VYU9_GLOAU